MQTLLFNHDDVQKLLPMKECVALMETTFRFLAQNRFTQPLRQVVKLPPAPSAASPEKISICASSAKEALALVVPSSTQQLSPTNVLANMPAHVTLPVEPPRSYMSSKIITVFPQNRSKFGLESHQGVVMLFNGSNGQILSISDAAEITALRTAAVSAVAMKYLLHISEEDQAVVKVAILGAGTQALQHTHAILAVLLAQQDEADLNKKITLKRSKQRIEFHYWNRTHRHAEELASEMHTHYNKSLNHHGNFAHATLVFTAKETVQEAVKDARVIVTATSATTPVLEYKHGIRKGAVILAVGSCSPMGRELDTELVAKSKVIVDKMESAVAEAGDLLIAANNGHGGLIKSVQEHITCELAQLVNACEKENCAKKAREKAKIQEADIVIFKSLGLAAEDLMSAIYIYEKEMKMLAQAQKQQASNHSSFCFTPSHL